MRLLSLIRLRADGVKGALRPALIACALVAALALAAVSLAAVKPAAHSAGSSVIRACYSTRTGAIALISFGESCHHGQKLITWDIGGRAGRAGATGPEGPPGVPGVKGATGPAGPNGSGTGGNGATGATGANGPVGAAGAAGKTGATGTTAGVNGAIGPAGPTGPNGATGAQGPPPGGSAAQGPTGPSGPAGAPLPAVLASGASETGVWGASSLMEPVVPPWLTQGGISFPIPLKARLVETKVHYVPVALTKELAEGKAGKTVKGCKATAAADPKLLEEPVAEAGNLCVYAGVEVLENAEFIGVGTAGEANGAEKQGAFVQFRVKEIPDEENGFIATAIRARGTWAVAE